MVGLCTKTTEEWIFTKRECSQVGHPIKLHCCTSNNIEASSILDAMVGDSRIEMYKVPSYNVTQNRHCYETAIGQLVGILDDVIEWLQYTGGQEYDARTLHNIDHTNGHPLDRNITEVRTWLTNKILVPHPQPEALEAVGVMKDELNKLLEDSVSIASYRHTTIYLTEEQWKSEGLVAALVSLNCSLTDEACAPDGYFRYRRFDNQLLGRLILTIPVSDDGKRIHHEVHPDQRELQRAQCSTIITTRELLRARLEASIAGSEIYMGIRGQDGPSGSSLSGTIDKVGEVDHARSAPPRALNPRTRQGCPFMRIMTQCLPRLCGLRRT